MSDLTPKQTLHGSISTGGSANPLRGNVMNRGLDGKSAYDYAVSKGYEGTEEEFAEKLKELMDDDQGVSSWNDLTDKPFYEDEEGNIYYLDEKFIPDTIARKEDIPEQSDALYLISELGLAGGEIIADDKGNVFTDENGVIYVI